MRLKILLLSSIASLTLSACMGASTNPHEGGLFGYSPAAYEERQRQRRQQLNAIREEQLREEAATEELEVRKINVASRVSRQQREVDNLARDAQRLSATLNRLKNGTPAQRASAGALASRQQALQKDAAALAGQADSTQKKKRIMQLREELKRLEQEAEDLSNL